MFYIALNKVTEILLSMKNADESLAKDCALRSLVGDEVNAEKEKERALSFYHSAITIERCKDSLFNSKFAIEQSDLLEKLKEQDAL